MPVDWRRWITTPTFDDPARNSRARLLNVATLAALVMAAIFIPIIILAVEVEFPLQLVFGRILPMIVVIGVTRFMLYRGQVEVAGTIMTVFAWLVLAFNTVTSFGLSSPSYFALMLVVLLAGILVSARAAVIAAGASALFGVVLAVLHRTNPGLYIPSPIENNWLTGMAGFIVFGVVLYIVVKDWNAALENYRAANQALVEAQASLEERVSARTRDLAIAAGIGRTISQARDLDQLLAAAIQLIQKGFSLYHTQIYLLDEDQRNLVLRAGSGEAGGRLVAQRHLLPMSATSINTAAANRRQAVLVADTTTSALFRPNPLLPETRSELAVPLTVGQTVIGVLNVQDDQREGLTEADLPVYETLAGQLAVAINNARLFTEVVESRSRLEQQARRLTVGSWQEYMDGIHRPEAMGRTYRDGQIKETGRDQALLAMPANTPLYSVPINTSGLTIGSIQIEPAEGASFTADDEATIQAVARQVAQQVENLRYLGLAETYRQTAEEAVRRLTREAWTEALAGGPPAFVYDGNQIAALEAEGEVDPAGYTAPLTIREEMIGEIAIGEMADDPAAVEMAAAVAERLSAHIENLRLAQQRETALHESELRSEELAAINRVAQAVSRQLDFSQLLETIHSSVSQVMQVEVFVVSTYDAAAHELHYPFVYDDGLRYEVSTGAPGPNSQLYQVIQSGEPLMNLFTAEEVAALEEGQHSMQVTIGSRRIPPSAIFVPLTIGARTVGALSVQSYAYNAYDERDMALLTGLANHVAVAFENARLFNQERRRAERERLVNEINQKILDTNSVEAALQTAIQELGRAFRARQARVELAPPGAEDKGDGHQHRPVNGQQQPSTAVNEPALRN